MKSYRILIADDHEIVRSGLSLVLGYQKGFTVVGQASDGEEAVREARRLNPDLVILDLMMPGMDGAEATRAILADNPKTHVVILTTYATSTEIITALDAGASGALSKDTSNAELITALHDILDGRQVLSPDIRDLMLASGSVRTLTARQLEILGYLAKGLSNRDIASLLNISEDGVKFHLRSLFSKLGAATRTEAVTIAIRMHLLNVCVSC